MGLTARACMVTCVAGHPAPVDAAGAPRDAGGHDEPRASRGTPEGLRHALRLGPAQDGATRHLSAQESHPREVGVVFFWLVWRGGGGEREGGSVCVKERERESV